MSNYVTMFQNDKEQIRQILREYEQEKGLAHGVQKDAVQNGFGARKKKSEAKACRGEWAFFFELKNINERPAFIFWDEGTTGLAGDILSCEEIEEKSAEGMLGPDQKLGRFLSRFQSGGNTGPGSFGRGKLIFQAASKQHSILIDSLREDDSQYIALDRKIIGNQLKQPPIPHVGEVAQEFITEKTGGSLDPLSKHGTRVIILNVDEEIVEAFNSSFENNDARTAQDSLYHMIAETWWEIIQMGANIYLRKNGDQLRVKPQGALGKIITAQNQINGYRVFKQTNIPVSINKSTYKIKELALIVSPHVIEDDFREIWVQRKRMKVGGIDRGLSKHHKIQKKLSGYLRLEPDLEALFEAAEGPTHYRFNHKVSALRQVREVLKTKIEEFQRELGFRSENTAGRAQNELNEALKELNEMANDLGLPTEFAGGKKQKPVSLTIDEFVLPDPTTTRVEFGDQIGPIRYRVKNLSGNVVSGKLVVTCEQGRNSKEVFTEECVVEPGKVSEVTVSSILMSKEDYTAASMMLVRARFQRVDVNTVYDQVTRSLWIGVDPKVSDEDDVSLSVFKPEFPRQDTARVEMGELIGNLGFRLSNKRNLDLKLNMDVKIRKCKSTETDVVELGTIYSERSYLLAAMTDIEVELDDLNISQELLGAVWSELAIADLRKCEIFFSIRFSETHEDLGRAKGDHAAPKKNIIFYCGVDPAGQSIFKHVDPFDDPADPRRAFVDGTNIQGYTFKVNLGHPAYKFVDNYDSDIREAYFQELMIFQACVLAIKDEVYEGPLAEFKDVFEGEDMPPHEAARGIDELVGSVLRKFRG